MTRSTHLTLRPGNHGIHCARGRNERGPALKQWQRPMQRVLGGLNQHVICHSAVETTHLLGRSDTSAVFRAIVTYRSRLAEEDRCRMHARPQGTRFRRSAGLSKSASPSCDSSSTPLIRRRFVSATLTRVREEFIVEWARDLPRDARLALLVHLERSAGQADEAPLLGESIHQYFKQRAMDSRRRPTKLFRRGRISLMIALVFLGASIAVGDAVASFLRDTHFAEIIREGLLIGGWVAMWRPLEVFLYDWWPIRAEARLFDRLRTMPVRNRVQNCAHRRLAGRLAGHPSGGAATVTGAPRSPGWTCETRSVARRYGTSAHPRRRTKDPGSGPQSNDRGIVPRK